MSVFSRVSAAASAFRSNPLNNPAVPLSSGAAFLFDTFGATPTASGEAVNEITAMQCDAVYACVNVLASDMSSLPFRVMRITDKGEEKAEDHDLYYLLGTEPNPEMTAPQFLSTWIGCAVLTGNGYAEIQRDTKDGNKVVALWPRNPRHVKMRRSGAGEKLEYGGVSRADDLVYDVTDTGTTRTIAAKDMLHLPGLSLDGWLGYNTVHAARQTIGTSKAAAKFIGGFFGRGSRPSGILTPTEVIKGGDVRLDQARKSWEQANSGENQGRTAVMPFGWTWTQVGLTMEQVQFLQIIGFTRAQIAGIFRVPPHMIGDTSRLSNSNHESQALEYVNFTLRPWLVKIEAEVQRKLMPRKGRTANTLFVRFDFSELIRGDFASQMAGFATGRQWSFYSTNDIRRKLGENPIGPEGDVYLAPLNMVPLERLIEDPPPPAPAGGSGDDSGDTTDDTEPQPAGNGGMNQQRLFERMGDAYGGLFRDGIGRMAMRSKRDADAVQQIFGPVLDVISGEATRQAFETFRLKPGTDLGQEKILRDCRKSIEKRAAEWTPATAFSPDGAADMQRAVRTITLNIFREAGSTLA